MKKIGVGVIGASTVSAGWATVAHLAALRALPEFDLRAVSTRHPDLAEAACEAAGVFAYDNYRDLIVHPDVDLVVVAVTAPEHYDLISTALNAGKMVFSEWPLGSSLPEAESLAELACSAGVRTAIGLYARYAPAVHHARDLVRRGFVGEVLTTTLVGSAMGWGAQTDQAHAYWFDAADGATSLSVPMLHALDALTFVLGDVESVAASAAVRRPSVRVVGEKRSRPVTASAHIAVSGRLRSGAIVSAFYRGNVSRGENLRWEINGTDGDLVLTASNGNIQVADLKLEGGCGSDISVAALEIPPSFSRSAEGLSNDLGANLLREYAAFARDLRNGTYLVPGFEHALSHHRLVAAIERAADTGVTQTVDQARH